MDEKRRNEKRESKIENVEKWYRAKKWKKRQNDILNNR